MAILTLRPSGDGTTTGWTKTGASTYASQVVDDPDSNDGDTSYINGPQSATSPLDSNIFLQLDDAGFDLSAVTLNTITLKVSHKKIETLGGRTHDLYLQLYRSDESTAITGESSVINTSTGSYTTTSRTVTVSGSHSGTDWDGARLRIRQHSANVGGPDLLSNARVTAVEIVIDYTMAIVPGTATATASVVAPTIIRTLYNELAVATATAVAPTAELDESVLEPFSITATVIAPTVIRAPVNRFSFRIPSNPGGEPGEIKMQLYLEATGCSEAVALSWWNETWWKPREENLFQTWRQAGLDVPPFCITVEPEMTCDGVPVCTAFTVADSSGDWDYSTVDAADAAVIEGLHANQALTVDSCVWTGDYDGSGSGITATVVFSMTADEDSGNPGMVVLTLEVTLTLTGDLAGTHTTTYELDNIDPEALGTRVLVATDSRVFAVTGGDITFPESFDVSAA